MKNKILLLIVSLLLIPTFVYAKDTCNDNDIKIKSITLKDLNGFSEEVEESTINNNTINLNLKMYDVGDSSTYEITVENTSIEDYYFTKDSMKLENDYLEYNLKNDSELIPAKEEKTIELKVSYKNKIPSDNYSDTNKLIISLSDKPLENPKTKMTYRFIFIIISLIILTIYTKITNKSVSKKKLFLIGTLLSIIPITTTALCTVNLNVEARIEIGNKQAIFLPGAEVNVKMKQLAGDDTSTVTDGHSFSDKNITAIVYSESEPIDSNKEEKNIVSTSDSPYPIYMWFEDGTIYWWSEDIHPSLNEDASYMFRSMNHLNDISGLKEFDTGNTINMKFLFQFDRSLSSLNSLRKWKTSKLETLQGTFAALTLDNLSGLEDWNISNVTNMNVTFSMSSIKNLSALKKWDVSNVTQMAYTFSVNPVITSLNGLENWDVSKVEEMFGLFWNDAKLISIDSLKNWNTSNVKLMYIMFASCKSIENIDALKNWDVSNVTDMNAMFATTIKITNLNALKNWNTSSLENIASIFWDMNSLVDISGLENWNTSKIKYMYGVFANTDGNTKPLKDITALKNWNVSNVEDMRAFFQNCTSIEDISSLRNWDVSKVKDFNNMFFKNTSLSNTSPINDWNISPTASFSQMFRNTLTHPEFTKVQGTWNSAGTFTPTP